VIIVVYDVTQRNTLTNGVRDWYEELKKNCEDINNLMLVLVGNKIDIEDQREVDKIEAEQFAKKIGAFYWEASAKTGFNVEEIFTDICSKLDENKHIKNKLFPSNPKINGRERLTVKSKSGKNLESKPEPKGRCCH